MKRRKAELTSSQDLLAESSRQEYEKIKEEVQTEPLQPIVDAVDMKWLKENENAFREKLPKSRNAGFTMAELLLGWEQISFQLYESKKANLSDKQSMYLRKSAAIKKEIQASVKKMQEWYKSVAKTALLVLDEDPSIEPNTPKNFLGANDGTFTFLNEKVPEWGQHESERISNEIILKTIYKSLALLGHSPYTNKDSSFQRLFKELKDLWINYVGRDDVLNQIAGIVNSFANNWKSTRKLFLNFLVLGPAGSGKTTIANYIAKILKYSGILATSTLRVTGRTDFIGQYLGTSAPKTTTLINSSLEGVLFIDEAYSLATRDSTDQNKMRFDQYSEEATTAMVGLLDKYRGQISVIAAGYENQMVNDFLKINEGMARRFPLRIDLKPLSAFNLTQIFVNILKMNYGIDPEIFYVNINGRRFSIALELLESVIESAPFLFPYGGGSMENLAAFASFYISSLKITGQGQFGACAMLNVLDLYNNKTYFDESIKSKKSLKAFIESKSQDETTTFSDWLDNWMSQSNIVCQTEFSHATSRPFVMTEKVSTKQTNTKPYFVTKTGKKIYAKDDIVKQYLSQ